MNQVHPQHRNSFHFFGHTHSRSTVDIHIKIARVSGAMVLLSFLVVNIYSSCYRLMFTEFSRLMFYLRQKYSGTVYPALLISFCYLMLSKLAIAPEKACQPGATTSFALHIPMSNSRTTMLSMLLMAVHTCLSRRHVKLLLQRLVDIMNLSSQPDMCYG